MRLAIPGQNVMTALKRLALTPELRSARPDPLRVSVFYTTGGLVHQEKLPFTQSKGEVKCTLPSLNVYSIVTLEKWALFPRRRFEILVEDRA